MVMSSIALGLDLPEDFFDKMIDRQDHNLRLLSYPPIRTSLLTRDGQARAGAHSGEFVLSQQNRLNLTPPSLRLWDLDTSVPGLGWWLRGPESPHKALSTCFTHSSFHSTGWSFEYSTSCVNSPEPLSSTPVTF